MQEKPQRAPTSSTGLRFVQGVRLCEHTSLRLGGPARRYAIATGEDHVRQAVQSTRGEDGGAAAPLLVLGGGSNLVISDAGFDGLVLHLDLQGIEQKRTGEHVVLDVGAGQVWHELVAQLVDDGLAGLECLAGIPGLVGATPIQNVGAYGQQVSDCLLSVRAYDCVDDRFVELPKEACELAYRDSRFKREPGRFVVTRVRLRVARSRKCVPIAYRELAQVLGVPLGGQAPLAEVQQAVLVLRRSKGMVLDANDPESVSAGSFFVNPVVDEKGFAAAQRRAEEVGAVAPGEVLPHFAIAAGRFKLAAAWLVEHAGFPKGFTSQNIGVSRKHALALVHRGGGSTTELISLARQIQNGVRERFGVALVPEPTLVGCTL